ncbi:MAG: dihydroorotase, partial [Nitrospiraceae bacterium]
PKGTLSEGADADIAVINTEKTFKVDAAKFQSKGRNTPFNMWVLKGTVEHTVSMGRIFDWS